MPRGFGLVNWRGAVVAGLNGALDFASGDGDSDGTLNPGFRPDVGGGTGGGRTGPLSVTRLKDDFAVDGNGGTGAYMVGNRNGEAPAMP